MYITVLVGSYLDRKFTLLPPLSIRPHGLLHFQASQTSIGKAALVEHCCLIIFALIRIQHCEVVGRCESVGVIRSECLFMSGKAALVEHCCLIIFALFRIQTCEVVGRCECGGQSVS
jgi:hypothetical protein